MATTVKMYSGNNVVNVWFLADQNVAHFYTPCIEFLYYLYNTEKLSKTMFSEP